ncbi:MAG: hypothetical protein J5722_03795 [Oscillospiraceae bacterium]|nr:hypothetical protein [Oscillospiraceae bacterium]
MKRKFIALAGALLMLLCPLTACGDNGGDVSEADLPYGATLITSSDLPVQVRYDHRFIEEPLAKQISAFYHAVQEQDTASYSKLLFPLYHNYEMDVVYKDRYTEDDMLNMIHDAYEQDFGKEFDFSLIDVVSLTVRDGQSTVRDALNLMLQQLAADEGDKNFVNDVQALYELSNDCYLCDRGSGKTGDTVSVTKGSQLYAVKYKNQWYLIYT